MSENIENRENVPSLEPNENGITDGGAGKGDMEGGKGHDGNKKLEDNLNGELAEGKGAKTYYVEDIPSPAVVTKVKKLDYLFILESPHTDEVKQGHPLAGDSGKSVTKFLLKKNNKNNTDKRIEAEMKKTFGEIVKDSYVRNDDDKKCANTLLNNKKIAIVNVSNVPLQVIDANRGDTNGIKEELKKIRDNAIKNETKGSIYLLELFINKLNKYILPNNKNLSIVVCGDFAKRYFEKFLLGDKKITINPNNKNQGLEANTELLKKQYQGAIKILYVLHPSYMQWEVIDTHHQNLNTLKNQF